MNINECANCLVHGWKQPKDRTSLLTCQNCQVIQYCSKECQLDHWMKLHKRHCKFFKDAAITEPWQHKEDDCILCQQAAAVGESQLAQIDNPNYECIFKAQFPAQLVHPHPFPVTGQSGDIFEKGIIVLWQLVRKYQLTHPDVALACNEEFEKVERTLEGERIAIWRDRKIYPQPQAQFYNRSSSPDLSDIENKMLGIKTMVNPFELWETIFLVEEIVFNVKMIRKLKNLKDPLANLPDDLTNIVSKGMDNNTEYLALATKVLEALATQVVPYKDLLKIIGGGRLEQECSFCSKEVDISFQNAFVYFSPLQLGTYSCGGKDCEDKAVVAKDDMERFLMVLSLMAVERKANMCDFCFQLTPVKQKGSEMRDIHRCRHCRTTMYCSQDCLYRDDQIHAKVCQKDKEGRKKKPRGSARRRIARKEMEMLDMDGKSNIFCEVLDKFKLKNAKKCQSTELESEQLKSAKKCQPNELECQPNELESEQLKSAKKCQPNELECQPNELESEQFADAEE